jgi:hypothetical protein
MSNLIAERNAYISAGSEDTPVDVLNKLATDDDARVRARVAENSKTPFWTIARLMNDGHKDVRISVATNPNLPKIFQLQLANDPHDDVRYALAEDHSAPLEVLQILASDDNVYVQHRAQKTLDKLLGRTSSNNAVQTCNCASTFVAA